MSIALDAVSSEEPRATLIRRLEAAAAAVHRLRLTHRFGDRAAQQVFDHRFAQAATAIREIRLWVALPRPDTFVDVEELLIDLLITLLTEHYGQLPQPRFEEATQRGFRWRAVLLGVGTVLLGLLPLAVLLLLQWYYRPPSEQFYYAAGLFAAAWVLTVVDPRAKDHLDVAKSIGGLLALKTDK